MAQFARPDSDVTDGGWEDTTGGDGDGANWDEISEVTPDDGSSFTRADDASTAMEVGLTNVTDPATGSGHIIRFRALATGTGGPERIRVQLYEGGTQIAAGPNQAITRGSWNTYTFTLSTAEADAINGQTGYNDLRLRFNPVANGDTIDLTWAELEVPDVTSETMPADSGSYSVAGQVINPAFAMPGDTGGYVLIGIAMNPGITMPTDVGVYVLTGQSLLGNIIAPLDAGVYDVVGVDANLLGGFVTVADTGVYILTGVDVDMLIGFIMAADTGIYILTGAGFLGKLVSLMDVGAYSTIGLSMISIIRLPLDTGAYSLTGQTTLFSIILGVDTGVYSLTGQAANLLLAALTRAGPGAYVITGKDITLIFTALHPSPLPTGVAWVMKIRKIPGS